MAQRRQMVLTQGERLFIERRRSGETQAQAAARYKVAVGAYANWEAGKAVVPREVRVVWTGLLPHERCIIRRRRAGWTIPTLAKAIGRSPYWVQEMEAGRVPVAELLAFWSKQPVGA